MDAAYRFSNPQLKQLILYITTGNNIFTFKITRNLMDFIMEQNIAA
jgi:hypothetical protein